MNIFLKAKHWQLFIPLVGIPVIIQGFVMSQIMNSVLTQDPGNFESLFKPFALIPFATILFMAVYYGWMWSIGIGLSKKLPFELKPNTTWFKITMIFPFVYLILFSFFMYSMIGSLSQMNENINPDFTYIGFIFPLHLMAMVCSFYNLYFVAKVIKTSEKQKGVGFGDYIGEFFLIWFFFVGVWILQPKINEMSEEYYEEEIV